MLESPAPTERKETEDGLVLVLTAEELIRAPYGWLIVTACLGEPGT